VPFIALLNVHPSRATDLRQPDRLRSEPDLSIEQYTDTFGNTCSRFAVPADDLRLYNSFTIEDSCALDEVNPNARQIPVEKTTARGWFFFGWGADVREGRY